MFNGIIEKAKALLGKGKPAPALESEQSKKKVLVIEGGGMRGIFLAGVLQAFADHRFFPFELIVGTSAGALTGCAFAAGQIHVARDALMTKLLSGRFIQLSNIISTDKHVLDLDWMIDTILKGPEPLNLDALAQTCPVIMTATHCPQNQEPQKIYLSTKNDDVFVALKATAAIPMFYRGFVEYKGYSLLDGGVLNPIPFAKAMEMGYADEDILVVTTRPKGYRKKQDSFWLRTLYEMYYKKPGYKPLVSVLQNSYESYNKLLDDMENNHPTMQVIYPPANFDVERLTTKPEKILEGFEQGVFAGNEFLFPDKFFVETEDISKKKVTN